MGHDENHNGLPLADMMGDWVMHSVSSGNSGSRGWTYGHSVVDANGNATFSGMMGSAGPGLRYADDVHDERRRDDHEWYGRRNGWRHDGWGHDDLHVPRDHEWAKNIMVSNYSDGSGGYPFTMQVK